MHAEEQAIVDDVVAREELHVLACLVHEPLPAGGSKVKPPLRVLDKLDRLDRLRERDAELAVLNKIRRWDARRGKNRFREHVIRYSWTRPDQIRPEQNRTEQNRTE